MPGGYACGCQQGYVADETECRDIDECLNESQCPKNAFCQNNLGSYTCQCYDGFEGELCTDVDECLTDKAGCDVHGFCSNSDMVISQNYHEPYTLRFLITLIPDFRRWLQMQLSTRLLR